MPICCVKALSNCIEELSGQEWSKDLIPVAVESSGVGSLFRALLYAPAFSCFTIGRKPNCSIRLRDVSISGIHCRIVLLRYSSHRKRETNHPINTDIACYIIDQSLNGTLIDNVKIEKEKPYLLSPNQIVSLGAPKLSNDGKSTTYIFAFRAVVVQNSECTTTSTIEIDEVGVGTSYTTTDNLATAVPPLQSVNTQLRDATPTDAFFDTRRLVDSRPSRQTAPLPPPDQNDTAPNFPIAAGSKKLSEMIRRLQDDNFRKAQEFAETVGELEQSEHARRQLTSDLAAERVRSEHLSATVKHLEMSLAEVRDVVGQCELRQTCLKEQLKLRVEKAASLEAALHDQWQRAEQLQQTLGSLESQLDSARTERAAAVAAESAAREKLQRCNEALESARGESEAALREASRVLEATKKEGEDKVRELRAQLQTANDKNDELNQLATTAQTRSRSLEQALAHLESQKSQWSLKESRYRELEGQLKRQIEELKKMCTTYSEESHNQRQFIQALKVMSSHISEFVRHALALATKVSDADDILCLAAPSDRGINSTQANTTSCDDDKPKGSSWSKTETEKVFAEYSLSPVLQKSPTFSQLTSLRWDDDCTKPNHEATQHSDDDEGGGTDDTLPRSPRSRPVAMINDKEGADIQKKHRCQSLPETLENTLPSEIRKLHSIPCKEHTTAQVTAPSNNNGRKRQNSERRSSLDKGPCKRHRLSQSEDQQQASNSSCRLLEAPDSPTQAINSIPSSLPSQAIVTPVPLGVPSRPFYGEPRSDNESTSDNEDEKDEGSVENQDESGGGQVESKSAIDPLLMPLPTLTDDLIFSK